MASPHALPVLDDPPLRVMALHALLYCPRLFYLEEVEEIRVADAAVYAGRELHTSLEAIAAQESGTWESLELASSAMGLFGKLDVLKRRDGQFIPYEHKRGRCRRSADGSAGTWASDRIQAGAYGMMLEEHLARARGETAFDIGTSSPGEDVAEVRVHYHAENVTVRLPLDEALRKDVYAAVRQARELRNTVNRPPIADNENLCRRCSLAPVCLPEEVRQDQNPEHNAVRLFPPDDQRGTLHVLSAGTTIGRAADRIVVRPREAPEQEYPSHEVATVLLHGFVQISTQALRLCVDRDIAVHWMTAGGEHIASLVATPGQVQRRIRQYRALADDATRLRLARQLVMAKVAAQHRYLLRATRDDGRGTAARQQIEPALSAISQTMDAIAHVTSVDALRGYEGEAATHYFTSINALLAESIPQALRYAGRSRRPTQDRFSAILNFGYALLYSATMRAILAAGLEPALGFYHTPRSAAHPLVLDLMELFRVLLWDMPVIGSLNRGQWDAAADFQVTKTKTWLSDSGKRKVIALFDSRLQESWKHPVANYSLSYARTMELEARLLEKEWTGEPGLFARLRLR